MVIDSSSLISLARSGLLGLLDHSPSEPVILDVVRAETVESGLGGGHVDAAAIQTSIARFPRRQGQSGELPDSVVLAAAREVGTLVANDLALGRRARNLGVSWLRTADLVVLLAGTGKIDRAEARRAVLALEQAGRLSPELAAEYLAELS